MASQEDPTNPANSNSDSTNSDAAPANSGSAKLASPSTTKMLGRGLFRLCPVCGAGGQFRFWVKMNSDCHRCGLTFERIEGHWIGAIGINTVVSFGILLGSLVVSFVVTFPDFPVIPLMVGHTLLALVFPVLFFPISRTLWTAIDIAMRPLDAHEVDWRQLQSDTQE